MKELCGEALKADPMEGKITTTFKADNGLKFLSATVTFNFICQDKKSLVDGQIVLCPDCCGKENKDL